MRLPKALRPQGATREAPSPQPPEPVDPRSLTAGTLRQVLEAGATWLERNRDPVNALNVFPVPDGDTGTNMSLTMRAAVEGAARAKSSDAGAVMRAIAQGAVMGARGNSGVILSQIVAGMARGVEGLETVDGPAMARALLEGAATAYRAVTRPVEGTILTVARAAGDGAMDLLRHVQSPTCADVVEAALEAAQQAVERTPEQLPVLRQAGVVDAGGEGYRIILEGMVIALQGKEVPEAGGAAPALAHSPAPHVDHSAGDVEGAGEEWGYCTQFIIRGESLDLLKIREELQDLAASALVVGDEELVRVHGHTEDPGQLLSYAVRFGRLQRISIEDMDAQHDEWLRTQVDEGSAIVPAEEGAGADPGVESEPALDLATVVVSPGAGLSEVFTSFGAGQVIAGGQTMNPSANDILAAARRTRARSVIVLPNNGNVVMTAQQAAQVAAEDGLTLHVVPTKTVPQGIAAQLAFNPAASPEENAEAMAEAAAAVRTVEVTRAVRSVTLEGVEVREGDTLGLLDDKLVASGPDTLDVAKRALEQGSAGTAEIITLYRGAGVPEEDAERFAGALREAFPRVSIELVDGGQPHYDYLISVE